MYIPNFSTTTHRTYISPPPSYKYIFMPPVATAVVPSMVVIMFFVTRGPPFVVTPVVHVHGCVCEAGGPPSVKYICFVLFV